jgi:hypothetical protein
MSKHLRFTILSIAFACLAIRAITQTSFAVAGQVVTSDGSGAPHASAEAVPLVRAGEEINMSELHWKQADNEGKFQLTLPPGRYEIRAKDEIDGYPDPNFLLSKDPNASFPIINVDSQQRPEVRVKLGAKGGTLEGELLNQATHSPVKRGKVIIADAQNPSIFVEVVADKGGYFHFAVSSKQLRISGSAPGYVVSSLAGSLTLVGGEHRKITLELAPARQASAVP